MFGVLAADVDEEVAVEAEVVAVAVGVGGGLADPLAVLLVGQGLEGGHGAIELALRTAPAEFVLAGFAPWKGRNRGTSDV